MYTVLDEDLNVVGFLSNKGMGQNDFWGDTITQQIAESQDVLGNVELSVDNVSRDIDVSGNSKSWNHTISNISVNNTTVGSQIKTGYYLIYQDEASKRYYLMRLTSVSEEVNLAGTHWKSASGVNAGIYDFSRRMLRAKSFVTNPNGNQTLGTFKNILKYVLGDSGWHVNLEDYNFPDVNFNISDGASVQSTLQSLIKLFDVDVDAYVKLTPQGKIASRVIEFRTQMGTDSGIRIRYGKNMTSMKREVLSDSIYTKLYVKGANDLSITKVNNGADYLLDERANHEYNPVGANSSPEVYLEGVITNSMITDGASLLAWGKKQLSLLNHPRINYTINSTDAPNAALGDTISVQDLHASEEILLSSRVIQKTISFANPNNNAVVLGEYSSLVTSVITGNDILGRIGSLQNDVTTLTSVTADVQGAVANKIDSSTALKLFQSSFSLELMNRVGDIISGINGDKSGVTITGKHITLDGYVKVNGDFVSKAFSTANATISKTLTIGSDGSIVNSYSKSDSFNGYTGNVSYALNGKFIFDKSGVNFSGNATGPSKPTSNSGTVSQRGIPFVPTKWTASSVLNEANIQMSATNVKGFSVKSDALSNGDESTLNLSAFNIQLNAGGYNTYIGPDMMMTDGAVQASGGFTTTSNSFFKNISAGVIDSGPIRINGGHSVYTTDGVALWMAGGSATGGAGVVVNDTFTVKKDMSVGTINSGGDINLGWTLKKNGTGLYPAHFNSLPGIHIFGTNSGIVFDEKNKFAYIVVNNTFYRITTGATGTGHWDN